MLLAAHRAPRRAALAVLACASVLTWSCSNTDKHTDMVLEAESYGPFTPSTIPAPPKSVYDGPLWRPAFDWPKSPVAPPANAPWRQALGGKPISGATAEAYVNAVKDYIAPAMKTLMYDYANWDGSKLGWYSSPWLALATEPIHGTYVGSSFDPETFPESGLKVPMTTNVLTLYDRVAAYTMSKMWGTTAEDFNATATSGQFDEGSIIVKAALTTASAADWPPMAGAQEWDIYQIGSRESGQKGADPLLEQVYFFQFDIIVKDTVAAPQTQWVFSTLVYDMNVQSSDPWDKMIPLGAMWGNDPQQMDPSKPLTETWINPQAPVYSTETLGWGDRLSGPNDGAVAQPAMVGGKKVDRIATISCMGCHLTAEHPMKSFLLPSPPSGHLITPTGPPAPQTKDGVMLVYEPGSAEWNTWFQNLAGNQPKDAGTIALDYGMNTAFKAVPTWYNAKHPQGERKSAAEMRSLLTFRATYHGREL